MPTNYSNQLRMRVASGAQRNARIAAMSSANREDSKERKDKLIKQRTVKAEKRKRETMQMSQEETVTKPKHVFRVHLHPLDMRPGKMVDDKTVEPIGNKPEGDKIKLTVPGANTGEARNAATRYAAKNFGPNNVKHIEYIGLKPEETVTEAKTFKFTPPDSNMVRAYSSSSQPRKDLEALHDRWTKIHNDDMAKPKSQQGIHPGLSDKYAALSKALGRENKMPKHPNLGIPMNTEETNTKKREEIEDVARMDGDGSKPTSEKSILSKTGEIKTKIVEEKPTMSLPNFGLSASLIAAARQIIEKKDDVKLTGGKTEVEVEPETADDRTDDDEDTSISKNKKKLDPVGDEDYDINNNGVDNDESDKYLKNRRKAIGKAIKEDRYSAGTAYWTKHPDGPRSVNVSPSKTSGSATIHYIETDKPGTKSKEVPTSELRHPDNISKPFVMKENEQLDELSKEKERAAISAGMRSVRTGNDDEKIDNDNDPKATSRALSRGVKQGQKMIMRGLSKKEVDLDERENSPHERASDIALSRQFGYPTSYDKKTPKTSFGRAANRSSAAYALRALRKNPDIDTETGADAVHQGWAKTATTSTDQTPEKKARRATLASTPYSELPDDEKQKDRVAFNAVRKTFNKATDKLITQGDFTSDELARIDEIAQAIFEVGTDGLDSEKKYAKGDVTNAVLSDEKKQKMNKK
jgi:hypothetical protein